MQYEFKVQSTCYITVTVLTIQYIYLKKNINLNIMYKISHVCDHYVIFMTIYYKLPTADILQHVNRFSWKQPVLEPHEWWGQWIKLYALMSSNYHIHNLTVASPEYQFSPATPITNTIQCKLYVSQVKSPFTFLQGHNSHILQI